MTENLGAGLWRSRRGRGRGPIVTKAISESGNYAYTTFESSVRFFLAQLREINKDQIGPIQLNVVDMPEAKHAGATKWHIDEDSRTITLFRIPIERSTRADKNLGQFQLTLPQLALLFAVAQLEGTSPWDLYKYV